MFDQATVAEPLSENVSRRFSVVRPSMARSGDIAAAAQDRLQLSAYGGVRSLSCEYHEGVLVLRGRVYSFYQKQLAQEAVRCLAGIQEIVNVVQVVAPNGS